jgi:hypothetical protein
LDRCESNFFLHDLPLFLHFKKFRASFGLVLNWKLPTKVFADAPQAHRLPRWNFALFLSPVQVAFVLMNLQFFEAFNATTVAANVELALLQMFFHLKASLC